MPLLPRGGLVSPEDDIHDRAEGAEDRDRAWPAEGVGRRLGVGEGLNDGLGRVAELVGCALSIQANMTVI